MNFNDVENFAPEQRESRAVESSSNAFNEAFDFNAQSFKSFQSDSLKSSQNTVDSTFGTLDFFDSNDVRNPTGFERPSSGPTPDVFDTVSKTVQQIPEALGRTFRDMGQALSHPGAVIDEAVENGRRILEDINAGR
jgi:hypothetical protein